MKNIEFNTKESYFARENTIAGSINIEEILNEPVLSEEKIHRIPARLKSAEEFVKKACISSGGWQSWSPAFEVFPGKKQPMSADALLPHLHSSLDFPETRFRASKNTILSPFVCYLRYEDFYLVFASTGSVSSPSQENTLLPPVQFVVNRRECKVYVELADKGKHWKENALLAKVSVFTASTFFEMSDTLKRIYNTGQFRQIDFLGKKALGWESWYNHYTDINEQLITESLRALAEKNTVLSRLKEQESNAPIVFQVDDGWETGVGDWTVHPEKFPSGMRHITDMAEENGLIPGLWFAPFLLYESSPVVKEHPEWLLRNLIGIPVCAGINPAWNGLKPVCCLDLSREDVLKYLDEVIGTAIEKWGFRYLKLDFMYAGMLHGKFENGGSAFEWYNRAIKTLTRRKFTADGKPIAYLGCGIPMEQSYHEFPLSRIGADTFEHWYHNHMRVIRWNGRNEAYLNLKNTLGRAHWDKAIYANDPDVIFLREKNCTLTTEEKKLIAITDYIFASQIMYSDDITDVTTEKEKTLTDEICTLYEKYRGEEFSVKEVEPDFYEIRSRSRKYSGSIDLRDGMTHRICIDECTDDE